MNVLNFVLLATFVSELSGARPFASVNPNRSGRGYEISKGRIKKLLYTRQSGTTSANAVHEDQESLNVMTTATQHLASEEATTSSVTNIGESWKKSCQTHKQFKTGSESFLNYLLRLQSCDMLAGRGYFLQEACENRTHNHTEYYRVAYLRFCDFELYKGVCRRKSEEKIAVFDVKLLNDLADASGEGSGDISSIFGENSGTHAPVTAQDVETFLHDEDGHMITLACRSVEEFSVSLEKNEVYKNINKSFIYNWNATLQSEGNPGTMSIPIVLFSEWYNPILPFCRAFTCGSSYEAYLNNSISFYECMPRKCRSTVVFSIIFDAILAVLTIIANSLVLGVAARTKIMRNIPGYFKISLALADLIVGLVVLPTCIFSTYTFYIGPLPFRHPGQIPRITDYISRSLANFIGFFVVFSFALSIYTMAMASLDRYLAITKPFQYRQGRYLTKRRCAVAFALIWFVCFLVALYPVFTSEPYNLSAFNLLLSTGISSSIVYAVGLCIPLIAVWSLNGAMLSQVCADGEKRRSIRATGVLSASGPQPSTKEKLAVPALYSVSQNDTEEQEHVCSKCGEVTTAKEEETESTVQDEAENPVQVTNTKQVVSRNISTSSISYYKNEKRPSVPTGDGIIQRLKRNRGNRGGLAIQRRNLARQSSITDTTANVERRLARTLAIMIGAFTVALMPNIVTLVIYVALSGNNSPNTQVRLATALYIASRILLSNSFWNCIIYSIRNRHFRRAMWAIFLLKKEKIDRKLRQSVTMSNWKRRSAMMSSSGSSVHEKQSLSKTSSASSSAALYQNKEHRRSTMMWSLSSSSPCPSRKGSTDILDNKQHVVKRSISHNVDLNANRSILKKHVKRSESAPAHDRGKFVIPTVNVEVIEETTDQSES